MNSVRIPLSDPRTRSTRVQMLTDVGCRAHYRHYAAGIHNSKYYSPLGKLLGYVQDFEPQTCRRPQDDDPRFAHATALKTRDEDMPFRLGGLGKLPSSFPALN